MRESDMLDYGSSTLMWSKQMTTRTFLCATAASASMGSFLLSLVTTLFWVIALGELDAVRMSAFFLMNIVFILYTFLFLVLAVVLVPDDEEGE